jgi:hypothetical protein
MDRDKRVGFEFEEYLVGSNGPLRPFGYKRNPNKFKIDLVSVGLPSVEAKRECCDYSKRDSDGNLVNMCVQLFTKKQRGKPERNGPWKSIRGHGGNRSVYIVGEKRSRGTWRIVFAGLAYQLAVTCESYMPGGRDHVASNLIFDKKSQKITALVPLASLESINHGMAWVLKYLRGCGAHWA